MQKHRCGNTDVRWEKWAEEIGRYNYASPDLIGPVRLSPIGPV